MNIMIVSGVKYLLGRGLEGPRDAKSRYKKDEIETHKLDECNYYRY